MSRFYELTNIIVKAYREGDFVNTQKFALEYLNLASEFKDNWNYGNAVHIANIYLGLMALRNENVQQAKEYLINAGLTPGSPQLNSFGPNMLLAKELLEFGERDVVLEYLDACKSFWLRIFRKRFMKMWKRKIRKEEIPDFGAHLIYHTSFNLPENFKESE